MFMVLLESTGLDGVMELWKEAQADFYSLAPLDLVVLLRESGFVGLSKKVFRNLETPRERPEYCDEYGTTFHPAIFEIVKKTDPATPENADELKLRRGLKYDQTWCSHPWLFGNRYPPVADNVNEWLGKLAVYAHVMQNDELAARVATAMKIPANKLVVPYQHPRPRTDQPRRQRTYPRSDDDSASAGPSAPPPIEVLDFPGMSSRMEVLQLYARDHPNFALYFNRVVDEESVDAFMDFALREYHLSFAMECIIDGPCCFSRTNRTAYCTETEAIIRMRIARNELPFAFARFSEAVLPLEIPYVNNALLGPLDAFVPSMRKFNDSIAVLLTDPTLVFAFDAFCDIWFNGLDDGTMPQDVPYKRAMAWRDTRAVEACVANKLTARGACIQALVTKPDRCERSWRDAFKRLEPAKPFSLWRRPVERPSLWLDPENLLKHCEDCVAPIIQARANADEIYTEIFTRKVVEIVKQRGKWVVAPVDYNRLPKPVTLPLWTLPHAMGGVLCGLSEQPPYTESEWNWRRNPDPTDVLVAWELAYSVVLDECSFTELRKFFAYAPTLEQTAGTVATCAEALLGDQNFDGFVNMLENVF